MRRILIIAMIVVWMIPSVCLAGGVVFLGDSLTFQGNWGRGIVNMGIPGHTTTDIWNRLGEVLALKPEKLFVMMGINDIDVGESGRLIPNYRKLLAKVRAESPATELYVLSLLPVNNRDYGAIINNQDIKRVNRSLKSLAPHYGARYIDLYTLFSKDDQLIREYTVEGVHLNAQGYKVWREALRPYLQNAGQGR